MNSQHAIIVHSLDGVISDWNAGAEAIFGYTRSEAIGKRFNFLVPPDASSEHQEMMRRIGRGEEVSRPELVRLHKSGERVEVRLTASPLRDRDGKLIGAVTALHDRVDVRRLEERCQETLRLEAFAHLVDGMAHDFNNLLTIILGSSEMLLSRGGEPGESGRGLIGEIHKAGQRSETLLRQLLVLSSKKAPEPKLLDLNSVVSHTERLVRRVTGDNILVTTQFAKNLPQIRADPAQVQQVIVSLAIGARDAMPTGGCVTLQTNVIRDTPAAAYAGAAAGEWVMLSVSDSGGTTSETSNGHTSAAVTESANGYSPELANVFNIVNSSGGHMEVERESGQGRTFKIFFPSVEQPPPVLAPRPPARALPAGGETVLLVEDEEVLRTIASRVLQLCAYTVLEASNGQDALWLAVNHTGPIHLLVTDVMLPQIGGRELAERMLASHPLLKILFLSGYPIEMAMEHGGLLPGSAFLQKPFATAKLAQKVRELLDQP